MPVVRLPVRGWRMVRPFVTVLTAWQRSCSRPLESPSVVRLRLEALIRELRSWVVNTFRIVNHSRRFATKSVGACHRTIRSNLGGGSTNRRFGSCFSYENMLVEVSLGSRHLATDLNRGSMKWHIGRLARKEKIGWLGCFPILAKYLQ